MTRVIAAKLTEEFVMSSQGSSQSSYYSVEIQSLLNSLNTTETGLTQVEAARRLASLEHLRPHRETAWSILLDQFKSPIIILLFCSAILSFTLLDDTTNGLIIVFILLASGFLGFWQELSAANAVAKLMGMIKTRGTVIRDGQDLDVPLEEIVAGDVIRLRAGELIPGDCRLLTARDLFLNEAALTGESFPAEKSVTRLPEPTPLGQRVNSLYLGTDVLSGFATAVVVGTGRNTEFGKISERLEVKSPETGFERGLRQFGQLLIKLVLVISVIVFWVNVGYQGKPFVESLITGLALAVGMTPQLLPAVTTVVLAAGAKEMARHQVIIKQLLAIENLGSMTVLCSDKTGTLTEGVIHLQDALDIAGKASERVAKYAYYNAFFQSGFANPIDRAICDRGNFETSSVQKVDEIPYDFVRKRLSVRITQEGQQLLITKGALAHVLECCVNAESESGAVVELASARTEIDRLFTEMSDEGLRVLGVAIRDVNGQHLSKSDETDMTFLGLLAFSDPPKADAEATIAQLKDLGIQLKVITGDNRAVAATISHRVGIQSPTIVTGSDLRTLSEAEIVKRSHEADVFAEVEPNQKEQIIRALQKNGEVVGYLGDGINDASALHAADVGISVAQAVDVAREAAQVVLLKQDLSVLVQGVLQGRRTFANTLKYVFFAIAANFGYMFSLAIASMFLPFPPLLASQILLVNLLADFPAMALATDAVDPEQIRRPRRWDVGYILRFMMSFGLASSIFDFMTFGTLYTMYGFEKEIFHTGWFIESTLTGLMILLAIRTQRPFFRSQPAPLFLFALISVAAVTVWIPFSPFAETLGFVTPSGRLLTAVFVITFLYLCGMELVKRLFARFMAH